MMTRLEVVVLAFTFALGARGTAEPVQEPALLRRACPDYVSYASVGQ